MSAMGASWDELDAVTQSRCGELAAYGMLDTQIADILLISTVQVSAVKESPRFREAQAKVLRERAQRAIDLNEGWDMVEERALTQVFETLNYNRDPNFALMAARVANNAKRASQSKPEAQVIDPAKVGTTVVLNMNKVYINASTKDNMLNITPNTTEQKGLPQKRNDMLAPKAVEALLNPPSTSKVDELYVEAFGNALDIAGVKLYDS